MKKSLLVSLVLLSCVLLVGCGKKSEENLAENVSETASDTQVSE
jgi:Tfp pilus assembly protein PilP